MVVGNFGRHVQRLEADMIILKFTMKLIIAMIQIPLTLLYFILNLVGSVLAGTGWIIGILVFIITAVCWLFGQFNAWYQPLIGIMIAGAVAFVPVMITDIGGSAILKIKGILHSVV